jgi:hypothetical protein
MASNRWLQTASTIAFVWAAIMVAISVAIAIPNVAVGGRVAGGIAWFGVALVAIGYGVCARGLRRAARPYNVLTLVGAVVWITFLGLAQVKVSFVGIVLNAVVAIIIATQWRHFAAPASVAGPR